MPRSSRRSTRNRGTNDVVAPGFGTNSDINQLTKDLGGSLPRNAVLAMMQSEGRGLVGASDGNSAGAAPFASPKTSSAWADFLQEEGGSAVAKAESSSSEKPPAKKLKMEDGGLVSTSTSSEKVEYDLAVLSSATDKSESYGSLVQSGTMDSTLVGRKNLKATDKAVYHLAVPTVLMPKVAITKVFTSCNAAHAIAIDKSNQAYGWGRVSETASTIRRETNLALKLFLH